MFLFLDTAQSELTKLSISVVPIDAPLKKSIPHSDVAAEPQGEPMLHQPKQLGASQKSLHSYHARHRKSVVSLGDRVASIATINEIYHEEEEIEQLSIW